MEKHVTNESANFAQNLCRIRKIMASPFISSFFQIRLFILLVIFSLFCPPLFADVVKPALVEINVSSEREISIEIRASIEALLTGINAKYKNTQDAPTAENMMNYARCLRMNCSRFLLHSNNTF